MTMEGMAPEDILRMEQENEMIDKEAQEKIARIIYGKQGIDLASPNTCREIARAILLAIEELGYRKIKDKPPLLSDEEMGKVKFDMGSPWGVGDRYTVGRAIAQAQWEICVKHYEG